MHASRFQTKLVQICILRCAPGIGGLFHGAVAFQLLQCRLIKIQESGEWRETSESSQTSLSLAKPSAADKSTGITLP